EDRWLLGRVRLYNGAADRPCGESRRSHCYLFVEPTHSLCDGADIERRIDSGAVHAATIECEAAFRRFHFLRSASPYQPRFDLDENLLTPPDFLADVFVVF